MKGLAVETVLYGIILVLAIVIITFLVIKIIPAFGDFMSLSLKGIKGSFCKFFGPLGSVLGC